MSPHSPPPDLVRLVLGELPAEKWIGFPVLVAVSGGADSVALLRLLVAISEKNLPPPAPRPPIMVAHVNHHTRPLSDADQRFVCKLADQLGLESHVAHLDPPSGTPSEESLRNARYQKLLQLASQTGARYLATGHTFDDQIETILFRIFRGTGLAGLSGIPSLRVAHESISIVRPLLKVRRQSIEAYLQTIDQPYCHDPSNTDPVYTRNYLRHTLLPELRTRFGPTVEQAIARLGQQADEAHAFLVQQSQPLAQAIISQDADRIELDCQRLIHFPAILIREWVSQIWSEQKWPRGSMNHAWWQTIADTLVSDQPHQVLNLPGAIRLEKKETRVTVSRSNLRDQTDSPSHQPSC